MAVPARPVSGQPIASAWGQVAHDTAVAMDVQAGTVNVSGTTQNGTAATFGPFAVHWIAYGPRA